MIDPAHAARARIECVGIAVLAAHEYGPCGHQRFGGGADQPRVGESPRQLQVRNLRSTHTCGSGRYEPPVLAIDSPAGSGRRLPPVEPVSLRRAAPHCHGSTRSQRPPGQIFGDGLALGGVQSLRLLLHGPDGEGGIDRLGRQQLQQAAVWRTGYAALVATGTPFGEQLGAGAIVCCHQLGCRKQPQQREQSRQVLHCANCRCRAFRWSSRCGMSASLEQ